MSLRIASALLGCMVTVSPAFARRPKSVRAVEPTPLPLHRSCWESRGRRGGGDPNIYYAGAASGGIFKRPTGACIGPRFLMTRRFLRLDPWRLRRATRT
jgi:hypothetical protein